MALVTGIVLGVPFTFLGKTRILFVGATVAGAVVATLIGIYVLGIDIELLNDPSPHVETQCEVKFLVSWQIVGALLGVVIVGLRFWLTPPAKTISPLAPREAGHE